MAAWGKVWELELLVKGLLWPQPSVKNSTVVLSRKWEEDLGKTLGKTEPVSFSQIYTSEWDFNSESTKATLNKKTAAEIDGVGKQISCLLFSCHKV